MDAGAAQILAVDIGGTKLAAGLVDVEGTLRRRVRVPTPTGGSAEELYVELRTLLEPLVSGAVVTSVGVGCGGPMVRGGEAVSPLNIPAWRDFPLRSRLVHDLALPVTVDNDAKAFALAEGWRGAASGLDNYLAMVVSTGVGGGLVVDGHLLDGASGNAGHIGHVVVVPDGSPCGCGGFGCLEAEISGTGILRRTGLRPEEVDVAERVRAGNLLGVALAGAVALLDLSLVCVGGSIALGFGADFFTAARESFHRHARLDYTGGATIVPAGLGDEAPLLGAARLAWPSAFA